MGKFKRVLLKLSGEALSGETGFGVDIDMVKSVAHQIKMIHDNDVQIGIVIGGGNFFRGRSSKDMHRFKADYVGMLATIMNSLHMESFLRAEGLDAEVMTSVRMEPICKFLDIDRANELLSKGTIVLFAGGTGSPFFSTDTAASLRACEIAADAVLAAKSIDGVYDSDPKENKNAKKYDHISYSQILTKQLKVMDLSAASMCMEAKIPTLVFSLSQPENLLRVVNGENLGTIID